MTSWIVSVLVDKHSPGGEWSRHNRLLVDRHSLYGGWSRLTDCWWKNILPVEDGPGCRLLMYHGNLFFSGISQIGRTVQDNYSSRMYVWIRIMLCIPQFTVVTRVARLVQGRHFQ
jgi:hypothetical protein